MRRSEAARYARWSAAVALLLASLTAGVYLKRGWQRIVENRKAPAPAPLNVEKQSSGLTLSKMDGPRKIFTIQASKSTDFKDMEDSLLENVKVTVYGKTGERHDVMQTKSCQYGKSSGSITCSGEVQIDLETAADADRVEKNPAITPQIVHVQTRSMVFDQHSETARTDQPVAFALPTGSGNALGAEYNSEEGTLHLLRDVTLNLRPSAKTQAGMAPEPKASSQEVRVAGTSLDFGRDQKTIHIQGPAQADSDTSRLTAGELTLEMDDAFRARRLLATAGGNGKPPEFTSQRDGDSIRIDADKMTALFAPDGSVDRLDGSGSVRGSRHSKLEEDEFHADSASLDLWPRVNQAKELSLAGGVFLKANLAKNGGSRVLQTGALRINFSEARGGNPSEPADVETLTAGSIEWTDAPSQPGIAPMSAKLQADKLQLELDSEGKPKRLNADGHVQTERAIPGHALQIATAHSGVAQLLASGGWSQIELQDDVKLTEADRSADADHATLIRAAQSVILTGHAVARDAATETRAPRIEFTSANGDIHAEGGVRSTDFSPNGSAVHFAQVPANITADKMQGNSKSGRALYSGHARLWQGDSVVEADSIELLRSARILNASGNVRAVFPQTPAPAPGAAQQSAQKKAVIWHVNSGTLSYNDASDMAHLEKNVIVQSPDQRIRAPRMDLYFTRNTASSQIAQNDAARKAVPQQISRAVGTGGVIVDQDGRRATAERGEYTASDGKFVMSGGNPTLYDGSSGATTGRQLTFFLADDTIIVDSENGSRTLTKHRVEK